MNARPGAASDGPIRPKNRRFRRISLFGGAWYRSRGETRRNRGSYGKNGHYSPNTGKIIIQTAQIRQAKGKPSRRKRKGELQHFDPPARELVTGQIIRQHHKEREAEDQQGAQETGRKDKSDPETRPGRGIADPSGYCGYSKAEGGRDDINRLDAGKEIEFVAKVGTAYRTGRGGAAEALGFIIFGFWFLQR